MANKFFRIPFASNGDKQAIPDGTTTDGYVSFNEGWGGDYERDLKTDTNAKPVGRKEMNGVLNAITVALRQYQTGAFPEYITAADNGGTQYPYDKGTVVRYLVNGAYTNYVSLVDNNTSIPGTDASKWQGFIYRRATQGEADAGTDDLLIITPPTLKQSIKNAIGEVTTELAPFLLPVGVIVAWGATVPPDGWIEANGQAFDRAKNPKLLAIFPSGAVPDLRGKFIRGWAHGSTVDPDSGRAIGSDQDQSVISHSHEIRLGYNGDGGNGKDKPPPYMRFPEPQMSSVRTTPFGGSETRPKNMALMYIVKTDQADNIKPEPTPTNIIVSPSTLTIGTGQTQQFTATVLPAELASKFPVSWASTNSSVGTISASGLFTAKSTAGTTEVIASVSSGLSVKVTVRVDILLTAISMAAIPNQQVGGTYTLIITKTPSNATESVVFTSSDTSIAGVTNDGTLVASGEGTNTITVTGTVSGKTASRAVTVTPASVVETYLQIKNNLNEIAGAGVDAQGIARTNLGLKALATKDSLTAVDVGAVPVANTTLPAGTNLNGATLPGEYFQNVTSNATLALSYPVTVAGVLKVYRTGVDDTGCRQVYMPYNSTAEYRRYAFGNPLTWGNWELLSGGVETVVINGTATLDASTVSGRRVLVMNPFPGHNINVQFEGNPLGNQWGPAGWGYSATADTETSLPAGNAGVQCHRLNIASGTNAGDWIVVQTGPAGVFHKKEVTGSPMDNITSAIKLVLSSSWRLIVTDLG